MSAWFDACLCQIDDLLDRIDDPEAVQHVLAIVQAPPMHMESIIHMRLPAETVPGAEDAPLPPARRHLLFLWEAFDKLPLSLAVPFAVPFRRALARRLFGACGPGFSAGENVRLRFARRIRVGAAVSCGRNGFLDGLGGIDIGDGAVLAEDVRVMTHVHGEGSPLDRRASKVVVGPGARVSCGAVLLPGVTVGARALIAAGAVVARDVPDNMIAAGRPATVLRERRDDREDPAEEGVWLY